MTRTLFTTFAAGLLAASAAADDGVVVTGIGQTLSPPDRLEMSVTIDGSAEMAGDAVTKYRGQRDRFVEAIQALGIEDLKTRPGAVRISQATSGGNNQRVVINGVVQQQAASRSYTIVETVTIDMPAGDEALDAASRLYDLGRDLGVSFVAPRGGSLIEPRFTDAEGATEKATADAMEDAREKAGRVAELAGRELGRVEAVEVIEQQSPTQSRPNMPGVVTYAGANFVTVGPPDGEDVDGDLLTRQRTTVRLKVRFSFAE